MDMRRQVGLPWPGRGFSVRDYIPGQPIPALILDPSRPGQEKVVVNPLKKWVTPFNIVTDPALITLAANGVSDPIPLVIDGKGHVEIFDAFYASQRSEGFTVRLFEAGNEFGEDARPYLMNREIHVATIASGGGVTLPISGAFPATSSPGRPFRWPETLWLDVSQEKRGAALFAVFRNLSSSSNQIRFTLHGRRWYYMQAPDPVARRMEEIYRSRPRSMPFFYTTDELASLAGNAGPTNFQMRMGDDGYTEWRKSMATSTGRFTALIQDASDGRKFSDLECVDTNLFGTGEFPHIAFEPTLFDPNFKLNFGLTDLSGSTNTIWITLGCRKIFEDPRDGALLRPGTTPGGGR